MADIEEIKKKNPIQDVMAEAGFDLVGHGRYLRSRQHDSLVVDTHLQAWHWNSENDAGDVINWVQRWKRTDFKGAVEFLSRRAGLPEPEWKGTDNQHRLAARVREDALTVGCRRMVHRLWRNDGALGYARSRGWTDETIKKAGLGFTGYNKPEELAELRKDFETNSIDPESPGAVAFLGFKGDFLEWAKRHSVNVPTELVSAKNLPPIWRGALVYPHVEAGRVMYVSLRLLPSVEPEGAKAKKNLRSILVGAKRPYFNWVYGPNEPEVVVVEGQADAITLAQWGIPAIALMGLQGNTDLLAQIRKHRHVYSGLDADVAGETATWPLARQLGALTRLVKWPEGAHA